MKAIDNLISRVRKLQTAVEGGLIQKVVEKNASAIIAMNVQQLYDEGVNAEGEEIMSYRPYAPRTIKIKQRRGQPYDRVTLRDTGAFHTSFKVNADSEQMDIDATDYKKPYLTARYGSKIFGLTKENKAKLRGLIMVEINKQLQRL